MDVSKFLLFLLVMMSTFERRSASETSHSTCTEQDSNTFKIIEGESFRFDDLYHSPDKNIIWSKKGLENETIIMDQRILYHGEAIYFLNITASDAGTYFAKDIMPSGECDIYFLEIIVFSAANRGNTTYGSIKNSNQNKRINCPDPVKNTCFDFNGTFTWYKGTNLIQDQNEAIFWVYKATKEHEDIYTCICTWTLHHKIYKSSGTRRLVVKERIIHRPVEILSPTTKQQLADEGVGIKLNCTAFCGTNVKSDCDATWHINGSPVKQGNGYSQTIKTVIEEPSKNTISTAILNIEKVSANDFQRAFNCVVMGFYTNNYTTLTLKQRESVYSLVSGGLCVFLISVFAAVLVKCFAIDLALLFRPYFLPGRQKKDMRIYDAFVVYQMQELDSDTEDQLSRFIQMLLSVLEDKCGYRLFIQGRDDIPGEDRLEQVESCMKQSRRLIVILTPGSRSESGITEKSSSSNQTSVIGGFEWQVGLHHALVQKEINVILIQLGDMGPQEYTHFPLGLQHLIRESAPIRWSGDSRRGAAWNSHFWKKVRYLMPATPAKKYALSAVI